jgi:hypothetical protein
LIVAKPQDIVVSPVAGSKSRQRLAPPHSQHLKLCSQRERVSILGTLRVATNARTRMFVKAPWVDPQAYPAPIVRPIASAGWMLDEGCHPSAITGS